MKFLEVRDGSDSVFELSALPNLSGNVVLILTYQMTNTMFGSINIGPAPILTGEETLEITRVMQGPSRGEIKVKRDIGIYSTGTGLLSGQPELIEQGPIEVIGNAEGELGMSLPEFE